MGDGLAWTPGRDGFHLRRRSASLTLMSDFHALLSPRSTVTMVYVSFGVAIGSLAGSMPSLMRNAGVSPEMLGFGLTLSTLLTVAAMSLGGQLARVASNRSILLTVLPIFALSLFAYLTAQSVPWFLLAILPMGACFGLTDLFMNAEAVAIEHDMRRPVFLRFHAALSAGVGVMAIAASYLATEVGTAAVGGVSAAFFGAAWLMVFRAIRPRALVRSTQAGTSSIPNKQPLILLGIAAGLIIAAETSALLWSAKLLDDLAPALAAIAGLGAAFFGLCNALVRFPGDRMRTRLGDMPLLVGSLVISILGFVALGFSSHFAVSVAAFASVGLGLALLIPCIFGISAGLAPSNRAGALSFVSMLTALPRILAPTLIGFAAAGLGMSFAFMLVASGLAVALALILTFRHRGYGT